MRKYGKTWNIVLMMASVAMGLLIMPPEVRAEMIASRMQSGRVVELVRQQLCSEIIQQQIQKFGLSASEARQIQAAFCDARVVEEIVRLQRQAAHASGRAIVPTRGLMTALQSAADTHVRTELQQRLSERAKGVFGDEKLIASRSSGNGGSLEARKALAQARRTLTVQKLVALGMTQKDASQTIAELKDSDIDGVFQGNIQIGYAAGVDWSSGPGLLLLLVIILGIAALIAGGPVVVVFIVVAVIAMVYFIAYDQL